jgi:hypothetical protein
LGQIRVFPRAHWRKLGRGNFSIGQILDGMRTQEDAVDVPFVEKIVSIRKRMQEHPEEPVGSAILIGLNENEPLTLIDGNHRMVAALLERPQRLSQLRFLCGFSPRMMECCWYNSNLLTLFRYGKNVLTHAGRDPEAELARLLQSTG